MKKHWILASALGAAAAMGLSACSSSTVDPSASPSAGQVQGGATSYGAEADIATLEAVTWEEDSAGIPALTFDLPFTVSDSATLVKEDGSGEEILAGQQVTFDYVIFDGTDGTVTYSTWDAEAQSINLNEGETNPALLDVMIGSHVGADILFAALDSTAAAEDTTAAPAEPGSLVMAITITGATTPLERAEGTAVEPVDGLPVVTLAEDGTPSVEIPATDPPTELVAQELITGEGDVVEAGQTISAHYTGWLWNGEQFDSSWGTGMPLSISLAPGSVIEGWTEGLVGHPVGSQVLLVIPPELGYGDTENGSIPAGSTLVFVVDILAAS